MMDVKKVMNNLKGKIDAVAVIDVFDEDEVQIYFKVRADLVPLIDAYNYLIVVNYKFVWLMNWFYNAGQKFCRYSDKHCAKLITYILHSPLMLEVTKNGPLLPRNARLWIPDITMYFWGGFVKVHRRRYGDVDYILYYNDVPLSQVLLKYKGRLMNCVHKHFMNLIEKALLDGRKSTATVYKQMYDIIKDYDFNKVFKQSAVLNFDKVKIVNIVDCSFASESVLKGTPYEGVLKNACTDTSFSVTTMLGIDGVIKAIKNGDDFITYLCRTLGDCVRLYNVLRSIVSEKKEIKEVQLVRVNGHKYFKGVNGQWGWNVNPTGDYVDEVVISFSRDKFLEDTVGVIKNIIRNNYVEVHTGGRLKSAIIYAKVPGIKIEY